MVKLFRGAFRYERSEPVNIAELQKRKLISYEGGEIYPEREFKLERSLERNIK